MSLSPFQVRGVIEAFYGTYYTAPERDDLIRFMGRHGYNFYVYGPKNDRQHRARWWQPYPDHVMAQFEATVAKAREAGVSFCYAISPINFDPAKHTLAQITAKLRAFYERGVRSFSLFLDDITGIDLPESEWKRDGRYARAHLEIAHGVYDWLRALDPGCQLSVCPSEYEGATKFSHYLHALGEGLHPDIDIFYCGPKTCSPQITNGDVADFIAVVRRAPLLWDNYPVNDLEMRPEMHIGPIRHRDEALYRVVKGVVANPMLQPEASKIPLITYGDYLRDPHGYEPWRSWEAALREIGGATVYVPLKLLAENSLQSCLGAEETKLERLARQAAAALREGQPLGSSAAVQALEAYLDHLDEAVYDLKNRMPNLALRADLRPWVEALDDWLWLGKRAMQVLRRMESGRPFELAVVEMGKQLIEARRNSRQIGGEATWPLVEHVLEEVERRRLHAVAAADELGEADREPGAFEEAA